MTEDEKQNRIYKLEGQIEQLNKALMHWRKEADKDSGAIKRLEATLVLYQKAFGSL